MTKFWVVIDNLLEFATFGYSDLQVLTPSEFEEQPKSVKDKAVFFGTCSDAYQYYRSH